MYAVVVQVLIDEHPELFGKNSSSTPTNTNNSGSDDAEAEWFFSYKNFQWAFAIVNSRHFQLPIPDLNSPNDVVATAATSGEALHHDEQSPPADKPTDAWVAQEQGIRPHLQPARLHSFLAPIADLLNFGPPCTRSYYNSETHVFEIKASCNLRQGQEVTFWYGDYECQDVLVGVYGFMHPMVPPCPTADDYRRASAEWKLRADQYREQVDIVRKLVRVRDAEIEYLQDILEACDCCRYEKRMDVPLLRHHEHVRGSNGQQQQQQQLQSNNNKQRIRKKDRGSNNENEEEEL
jgi:hypothetical protein